MSAARTRVLALGLDATSPELVRRWAADGTMPNLGALVERGLRGAVRGVEGFYVGSTWPSTVTGVNPARHGVHYELQLSPGTYDLRRVQHGEFLRAEPIWEALSRQGRRVAALDVPLGGPAERINGVQVVDWGGHDVFFGLRTRPPELAEWLVERYGMHPHGPSCDVKREGLDEYREFVDRQVQAIPTKTAWTRALLERGDWDLFLQVYTEGHCVGHQCWHLHDPSHPAHDPAVAAATGDPLRRVYAELDGAVGELVAAAAGGHVLVWASHGMSSWRGAHFLLPDILVRLGVCEPEPAPGGPGAWARRAAHAAWRRLPEAARDPVRRLRTAIRDRPGSRRAARSAEDDDRPSRTRSVARLPADAANSLCFPVHNGTAASGIRLNLAGREPAGRLRPDDVDGFCAELAGKLLEIVDERTGDPLVQRVLRTREVFRGPHLDLLPDLLVEWCDEPPTGSSIVGRGEAARVAIRSPGIGTLEGVNRFGRTGGHRPDGWFILAGPDVEAGRQPEGISVYDIAPTLAALAGGAMPDAEGRSIPGGPTTAG